MNNLLDSKRKLLFFKSHRRGMRELDIFLLKFAEKYLKTLSEEDLNQYEKLLNESDNDLYSWFFNKTSIPKEHYNKITKLLLTIRVNEEL